MVTDPAGLEDRSGMILKATGLKTPTWAIGNTALKIDVDGTAWRIVGSEFVQIAGVVQDGTIEQQATISLGLEATQEVDIVTGQILRDDPPTASIRVNATYCEPLFDATHLRQIAAECHRLADVLDGTAVGR